MKLPHRKLIFVNYMELRPAPSLPPGEYAIIGDSLADLLRSAFNGSD